MRESFEFSTDIIESSNGTEQRRSRRGLPRRTVDFSAVVRDHHLRRISNALASGAAQDICIPDILRGLPTSAAFTGGTAVAVPGASGKFTEVGEPVALVGAGETVFSTLANVSYSSVELADPVTRSFPLGARLCPLMQGRVGGSLGLSMLTDTVATADVRLMERPGTALKVDEITGELIEFTDEYSFEFGSPLPEPATTLDGETLFDFRPNWRARPQLSYAQRYQTLDFGYGRTSHEAPITTPQYSITHTYLGKTAAEMSDLAAFFILMKGRRGAFRCPTGTSDMLLRPDNVITSSLVADGAEVGQTSQANPLRTAVRILMRDGTVYDRYVTGVSIANDRSTFSLRDSIPLSESSDVAKVSWLPLCRFGSDAMSIEWLTDQVAQTVLTVTAVSA